MKKSMWATLLVVVVVVGFISGFFGERVADLVMDAPTQNAAGVANIAFLTGSPAFAGAQGTATFVGSQAVGTFKLTLTGATAAANTTVNVFVDATMVGALKLDKAGNGVLSVAFPTAAGVVFPGADLLTPVTVKAANGDIIASGTF